MNKTHAYLSEESWLTDKLIRLAARFAAKELMKTDERTDKIDETDETNENGH